MLYYKQASELFGNRRQNLGSSRSPCRVLVFEGHRLHWKKKWSHFDLKRWVTGRTKIQPGIPSNWRIFESIWLYNTSQILNLTLNIESIRFSILSLFDSQYRVNLTLNIKSIWLSISSQFDSQYRVNLTLNIESFWLSIESIWLKYSPITQNPGSNFSSACDSTF